MKRIKKISFLRILLSGTGARNAEPKILLGYLLYILFGCVLLCLPFSMKHHIPLIDNLFNATSALSTTGLCTATVDNYTFFGQFVLLALIQIGGIGFMTISSYILLASFHHLNPAGKNILDVSLTRPANFSLKELIRTIIYFTFSVELIGAIALMFCFLDKGVPNAIWNAVFHSISSFCTAGFSIFPNNIESFKFDFWINIIISALSYLGAMGFIVVLDVWKKLHDKRRRITFTSKTILAVTTFLAVSGTIIVFFEEPSIRDFSLGNRWMVSFFHTMSAMTTVGFNSLPVGTFSNATLMTLIALMIIGASPSGTGGGLKSTTLPAIFGLLKSKINNTEKVVIFNNSIPKNRVNAAVSTFIIYATTLFAGTYLLCFFEQKNLTDLFFEAASALGTVGLSTGISAEMSVSGKILLIIMMFIGRTGVVTVGAVFLHRATVPRKKSEEETDLAV